MQPHSCLVVAAAPWWGGVIPRASRVPGSRERLGESTLPSVPLPPAGHVPSGSHSPSAPPGPSCEPEFGCGNRAAGGRALSQTKARPLPGPINPPAFQPLLFPGSPISPGARVPSLQYPKASLTLQSLALGALDDKIASARGRVWKACLGVMGIDGSLRLVGDLVCLCGALCFGTVRFERELCVSV